MGEGDLFAEAYACAGNRPMNVSVYAASGGEALMLDCRRIVTTCPTSCAFHARLIQNLLSVVARKNIQLSGKMEHLSRRTTREKLLSYLSERSEQAGSLTFEIPFNRQELSDFLCVERSAMSAELSRMKRDGLLSYQKNRFTLHMPGEDLGRERRDGH